MNKIYLEKLDSSSGSCLHIKLKINNSDVGVLYLKEHEVELLLKTLRGGIRSTEILLETNIYDDGSDFDDENFENADDDNDWSSIK